MIQRVAFVPTYALRTERFYDLVGSLCDLTLLGLAVVTTEAVSARGAVLAACVALWALRLGAFLTVRAMRAGHDRRFAEMKHSALRFLMAWTLQDLGQA